MIELMAVVMPKPSDMQELKRRLTEDIVRCARKFIEKKGGSAGIFEWDEGWNINIELLSEWPEMIQVITVDQARKEAGKILKERDNVEVVLRTDPFGSSPNKLLLVKK